MICIDNFEHLLSMKEAEHIDTSNAEFQTALQIVNYTRRSLFLTGKAGTGKSTFLRYICQTTKKKHVVLAPTGIAAINAGGATLHSFFKIPFHPILPNDVRFAERHIKETLKYSGEKRKIIRELELIIIDEISMVRADIIDFVDKVLRIYSDNRREPFGGKQVLLVGDIYQLEPVVKEDERQLLRPFYPSHFFFDAHVFRQMPLVSIELRKVYRQNNPHFISLLDKIRCNQISTADLAILNQRVGKSLPSDSTHLSITLSTRRDTVDHINEQCLDALPGDKQVLIGEITGDFPESTLPTSMQLELKVGSQVMFIKNDVERRWVNGTLGVVTAMDVSNGDGDENNCISVMTEEGTEYDVGLDIWSNMRYTYNEKEQKIEEEEIGRFIQYPLKLAWAITVHKSQGLTFQHVNIDFSGGAFACGQTYVALSRCVSLEGISLKEPLRLSDIFVNSEVVRFSRTYNNSKVIDDAIRSAQADIEYREAVKAFDAGNFDTFLDQFFKAIHHRYDIEKPLPKRFIRMKLSRLNRMNEENQRLRADIASREAYLKELAAEYVLMGKDCEREKMPDAAIANYRKALRLYPECQEAIRRLHKLGAS